MDKGTFASYGWIVITVIVIAIMIAFASPFGDFVVDGVKDAMTNFESTATEELAKERDNVKFDGAGSGGGSTPQVYELSGEWTWNDTLPIPSREGYIAEPVQFNQWYYYIYIQGDGLWYDDDLDPSDDMPTQVYDPTMTWFDDEYKTIDFGSTPQEVSEELYNYVRANATQQ